MIVYVSNYFYCHSRRFLLGAGSLFLNSWVTYVAHFRVKYITC